MANIFLSYANEDHERARQLAAALEAMGWTVYWDRKVSAGGTYRGVIESEIKKSDCVLVLWSKASISSHWVRDEANEGLERGILVPVLIDAIEPPMGFRSIHAADLAEYQGDETSPGFRQLVSDLTALTAPAAAPSRDPVPSAPARRLPASGAGILKRVWDMFRPRDRERSVRKSAPPSPAPAPVGATPEPAPEAAPRTPDPVFLGVSAPRRVEPGGVFSARFVVYIEVLEERVRQQLKELGGDEAQSALGIAPDRAARWKVGTPVTVRLEAGPHISVRPPEASFEWSGRNNLVSFSLTVASNAPAARIQLRFEAFIEGLPVAFIPLDIAIAQAADPSRATASARPAATAFASYSSLDAQAVTLCLSALSRWDAGLKVFMDCLDLKPNEPWRQELERVIPEQDTFFLFWSANAMKSKWVDWEWRHASAKKGIDAIRPFPLDDPAVAPPPPELQHLHFRDRYMMAREALARVAERRT